MILDPNRVGKSPDLSCRPHAAAPLHPGVYWKPVWHMLDGQFDLTLANAMYVRNVPGRKSDMKDARWREL